MAQTRIPRTGASISTAVPVCVLRRSTLGMLGGGGCVCTYPGLVVIATTIEWL